MHRGVVDSRIAVRGVDGDALLAAAELWVRRRGVLAGPV
jgi:hypothetical protein